MTGNIVQRSRARSCFPQCTRSRAKGGLTRRNSLSRPKGTPMGEPYQGEDEGARHVATRWVVQWGSVASPEEQTANRARGSIPSHTALKWKSFMAAIT